MELLAHEGVELEGADAVVVGRSKLVGVPVARLLLMANATVTMCHSRTRDLDAVCARADILVAAVGVPRLLGAAAVKPGAVVIDVGVNRLEEGLVGDVDFDAAAEVASAITPVPGGVGPMTIAMLLHNTLQAAPARRRPMSPAEAARQGDGPGTRNSTTPKRPADAKRSESASAGCAPARRSTCVAAILLFVLMFLDWFGVKATNSAEPLGGVDHLATRGGNAWQALEVIPLFLMLAIVVAVGAALLRLVGSDWKPAIPPGAAVCVLGLLAALLILIRIISPPGPARALLEGAFDIDPEAADLPRPRRRARHRLRRLAGDGRGRHLVRRSRPNGWSRRARPGARKSRST